MQPEPEEWVLKLMVEGYEEGLAETERRRSLGGDWSVMDADEGCRGARENMMPSEAPRCYCTPPYRYAPCTCAF